MKSVYTSLASAWVPCFLGASALAVVSACGGATVANAPAALEPAPAPPPAEVEAPEVAADCDLEVYVATLETAELAWAQFVARTPDHLDGFAAEDPGDIMEVEDQTSEVVGSLEWLHEIRAACGLDAPPPRAPSRLRERFSALIERSIEHERSGADRRAEFRRELDSIVSGMGDALREARRAREDVAARAPGTECERALTLTTADWTTIARRQEESYAEDERTAMDRNTWDDEWMDEQNQAVIDTRAIAGSVEWDPAEALRLLRGSSSLRAWSTHAELVASLEALAQLCAEELSDEAAPGPEP